ncbi:hypothetical protein HTZ84_09470 [Haloterrigena sp. SYSU A558-1]|uniref:Uncharacterized protein n=1 Tax=Haloterrigena gelatinilytica TaxID=2741724 RepID=A0ABX2L8E0_9EURY|nr:hypothetical protein [Haloterrigena gelatinilytica]NUC72534.1 hypothetical protein [Haloterrigena gelatinilytica]
MSDGHEHDNETIEELVTALPAFMPRDEESGNYDLLWAAAEAINRLDEDIETVEKAMTLQEAEDAASIDRIADVVGASRRDGESLEKYRARVLMEFQSLTAEGTVGDIFTLLASVLRCEVDELWYQDWRLLYDEPSSVAFLVPYQRVVDSVLSAADVRDIADKLNPAGKQVKLQYNGSFRPVSVEEYENEDHNPNRGFGTLDENGDPAPSGGTFGGLIQ